MCNWLRDLAISLNPHEREGLLCSGVSMRQIGTYWNHACQRERERERKRDVVEEVGWRHAEIASASKLTHVPSISMKYSLLSQPSCLRMWLCWTLLFLPVKKEQLGARLSWREKYDWGFDIQRFSDGYPRSLHPRYLACFSTSGADGFYLDHRAWSCWRVSINASCRPMYFGAWLGGEFVGVDEWCNTLPPIAFRIFSV